jgi:tetrapyrrole methylase family protein/MazG family protein
MRLDRLAASPFDPSLALLILPPREAAAIAVGQTVPGRHAHGADPVALLQRLYPADHPLFGTADDATVGTADPRLMAGGAHLLPALAAADNVAGAFGLPWLVDRLRQPDGCPWDREQDHLTLKPFLLEESYEVYDALDGDASPALAEELGDLLLQIVLHAQFAAEAGAFDLSDVQAAITRKIIRRHPHVFGDAQAATPREVMRNWEQLKAAERAASGGGPRQAGRHGASAAGWDGSAAPPAVDPDMPAAFAGLSRSLPALAYANEMQARAAGLGYDWPDLEGVIDKIAEEASELLAADDERHRREEYGDLLFVIVNLGRKMGIDPEGALRSASRKFAARFARVERLADEQGLQLRALGLDALDELWQAAKRDETLKGDPG